MITSDHFNDATVGDIFTVKGRWTPMDGTAPIAIYHHNLNSSGWASVGNIFAVPEGTGPGQGIPLRAIVEAGYVVLSSDYGGSLWGNATDHGYIANVMNYAAFKAGYPSVGGGLDILATNPYLNGYIVSGRKVFVFGTSMGGLSVMSFAARYPNVCGAVAGILPVLNQNTNRTNFAVDAAYGGLYTDASYGSNHNPTYQATQGKFNTLPTRVWYGSADIYATPTDMAGFAANIVAAGGPAASSDPAAIFNLEELLPTGQQHTEEATGYVPLETLVNFARRFCPIS